MRPTRHNAQISRKLPKKQIAKGAAIAAGVGIVGFVLLQISSAATEAIGAEAESGVLGGKSAQLVDTAAGGGQSIRFGGLGRVADAPYNVKVWTGGNSLAVVWAPTFKAAKNYEVYRNNALVATTTPVNYYQDSLATSGRMYIDTGISTGGLYTYKVRAVAEDGSKTPFTEAAPVAVPANTTPVPAITVDTSAGGSDEAKRILNSDIKAQLQTWYPKISDALAYPEYTPRSSLKLKFDPTVTDVLATGKDDIIKFNPEWLEKNFYGALGASLHEATKIVQSYPKDDTSSWKAASGIQAWVRDWMTLERFHIPAIGGSVTSGDAEAAHVLQWGQVRNDPALVRKVNQKLHSDSFSDSFFTGLTGGKSPATLRDELNKQYFSAYGPIIGKGNRCLDIPNNVSTEDTQFQLWDCLPASGGQSWFLQYLDAGAHGSDRRTAIIGTGKVTTSGYMCISVADDGVRVTSQGCVYRRDPGQIWITNKDGSLLNPASGKCLTATNDGATNGTQLIVSSCETVSSGQVWAWSIN